MPKQTLPENLIDAGSTPLYKINPHVDTESTYYNTTGTSLTLPDQTMTIKEILQRHVRGQRIPDQMVGYYDDDNDPLELNGRNIETMDLSEKYDLLNRVRHETSAKRDKFKQQNKEAYENEVLRKAEEKIKAESAENTKNISKDEKAA